MARKTEQLRADRHGTHEAAFKRNKAIVYRTQEICGICGRPVDKTLAYPDPMSKSIDHIVPISRGGHPSAISNLQLAHLVCNRAKHTRLQGASAMTATDVPNNRDLPWSIDWRTWRPKEDTDD